jgi:hypothetical protein
VQTSTGVEHKKKALLVDCETVHGEDTGVNEFTTGEDGVDRQQSDGPLTEEQ